MAGQVARLEGFPLSPPSPFSSFPSVSYTHTHARVANRFTEETPLAARWIESPIRQKNAPFLHLALPEIEPQDERRQEADRRGLRADWELPRGASGNNVEIDLILNY